MIESYLTTGLCGTCYRDLEAEIQFRSDGAAYIVKHCPVHGYEEAMVEKSWRFWKSAHDEKDERLRSIYNEITCIESTDRCNVQCAHCYHDPDNSIPDISADLLVKKAISIPTRNVALMGAEPTMRNDLPEVISRIKETPFKGEGDREVSIYSNGINLENIELVQSLEQAGLDGCSISVHSPKYHKEAIWNKVSRGIDNMVSTDIELGHVSFTVSNVDDMRYAVDKMLWFRDNNKLPLDFCIRSSADIGRSPSAEEVFVSQLYDMLTQVCLEKRLKVCRDKDFGSNPYHIHYTVDSFKLVLIHWPSVKSISTQYVTHGPWASFIPNTWGNFTIQIILREGWKKGWWQGQRLFDDISIKAVD